MSKTEGFFPKGSSQVRYIYYDLIEQELIHVRKHMRQHLKPVECSICHYRAAEQKDVRRHAERFHNSWAKQHWEVEDQFYCEICGISFTRNDNLQKHHKRKHSSSWIA